MGRVNIRYNTAMYLYVAINAFVLGILVRTYYEIDVALVLFLLLTAGVLAVLGRLRNMRSTTAVVVFFIFLVFGVGRFAHFDQATGDPQLERKIDQSVLLRGVVIDEPDVREDDMRLTVRIDTLGEESVDPSKVLVTTELYPEWQYGDVVQVSGKLQKPEAFVTDEGKLFKYDEFLAKDRIFYRMYRPTLEKVGEGGGNWFIGNLFALKRTLIAQVERMIPQPHAALVGGVVFGAKRALGEELQDDFRTTGLIHIVVLSGYNVTIVAEFIMAVLFFLPFTLQLIVGTLAIIGFALMTGAGATIVRASIMAILVLIARATGRVSDMTRLLFIAGFLMLLVNPKILVYDASFQLSFLATFGLLYVSPLIAPYVSRVTERFGLREVLIATLATQIFVLPAILYKMGEVSLVAVPVNMLVLLVIPMTMLLGFLAGVVGLFSTLLAWPFAFGAFFLLSYELFIVHIFSSLPFASLHIPQFPLWGVGIWYLVYVVMLWRKRE